MKNFFSLITIFLFTISFSQELKNFVIPKDYEKTLEIKGDLDKDGKEETVIVFNTNLKTKSEGVERIFYILKNVNGNVKIWKENSSVIIDSKYGFYPTENKLDVRIKNNCIIISQLFFTNSRHSDTSKYTFRFQNGDFYLIGALYQLDDTCDYNFTYEANFSTAKWIVDEQYLSCDDEKTDIPKDYHKEFIHKFTTLIKMNGFRLGENKFKIPNSNNYFYY
ncbi:hypothetical protein CHRY9390_01834 [Chryseobacterium aquaeductus]|uniref:Uncharacterized protein n=1 Tax=Chryseobacterium aquaeductus TaxID=2675056 RepID=A0A9N8MNJ8_9FLAO|nr:hypothetical protein [Chryseobacterium aquaeductus]CAA7331147.1 hypothetical protein CHRY9390_01834 [Chryseobacterium potabilaquae]CAD7808461.1 hypothetical protein CHRY9390_01834 [Chryseobacterium aquaeductus]